MQAAFDQGGLDAICKAVVALLNEQEARHQAIVAKLEARIAELEKRLNQNSSNSSKPPSSDGFKRTKSLRPKNSGRNPGGQPGHKGQTLLQNPSPDITIDIPLDVCPKCGGDLSEQAATEEEKRQVFDLPPIKVQVTEHRAERKICPHCGYASTAKFPTDVDAPTQYGPGMQAVMSYLNVRQLIPCARTAEVCEDLFGHRPSAGSVVQAVVKCSARLASSVEEIRKTLLQSPVLHCDETGIRCIGSTHWLHIASTATHTLYSYSSKRGIDGFAVANVLAHYKGILVHDFWNPYDTLGCYHARCGAHLLRELKSFIESGHFWAEKLMAILLEMKQATDDARAKKQKSVKASFRKRLELDYDQWVKIGLEAHPEQIKPEGKRGRAKQSPETNFLRRLRDKREEVLLFLNDLNVPFDNNQAERDLRMIKVQQKVSGCFRSEEGARRFCVVSSCISTIRKQGLNLMETLKSVFTGNSVNLGT